MEPLYCGHLGDLVKCPHFRGKFTLGKHIWDMAKCPYYRGILISGVSFKRGSTVYLYDPCILDRLKLKGSSHVICLQLIISVVVLNCFLDKEL